MPPRGKKGVTSSEAVNFGKFSCSLSEINKRLQRPANKPIGGKS